MMCEDSCLKKSVILAVLIFFTFLLQGQTKVLFEDVLNPEELYVDGEHVYISEEGVIRVFSLTDGKKLYQLTNKGEGAGEFRSSPNLTFFSEYIVATGAGKVVFYQRGGK